MTEQEWLTSADPAVMLECLRRWPERRVAGRDIGHNCRYSDRLLRLFACACCYQVWDSLTDERSRRAVEVASRYADGLATAEERGVAGSEAGEAPRGEFGTYWTVKNAPTRIAAWSVWSDAAEAARTVAGAQWGQKAVPPATQAALLREIGGNPFRPVLQEVPSRWGGTYIFGPKGMRDPTVRHLAQAAYEQRPRAACGRCGGNGFRHPARTNPSYDACPDCHGDGTIESGHLDAAALLVLSDALEEAGCPAEVKCGVGGTAVKVVTTTPNPLLAHLRSPGPHVRGCWVADLILGKS